MQDVDFFLR